MNESPLKGKVVRFPASLSFLNEIREEFVSFLKDLGVGDADVNLWKLVFTESVVNAIVHGSGEDESKQVEVIWNYAVEEVRLEVTDSGTGPSAEKTSHPKLPEDPLQAHGRGLFIMDDFCDHFEHWRSAQGYRQIMRKKHSADMLDEASDPVLEQALEEISLCYESLAAFYRLGDALITAEKISEFISQATEDLKALVHADRVFLSLREDLQQSLTEELHRLEFFDNTLLQSANVQSVLESNQEFVWENPEEVLDDLDLESFDCGLAYPIKAKGENFGVIILARAEMDNYFNAAELNTMRTFGDLFGIAIAQANNAVAREREQRAMREVEIAAEMQDTMFPVPKLPECSQWELFAKRKSAREVGGDYVDACRKENGELVLLMVDVMGKGVPAAFLAAMLRTALHINIKNQPAVSTLDLVNALNQILFFQVGDLGMFATCAVATVSEDLKKIEIVNAGHCPVLLLKNDEVICEIEPSGPPLGLFDDAAFDVEEFPLAGGEGVLMITDGLYEWEEKEEIWGWENFMDFLGPRYFEQPKALWEDLQQAITRAAPDDEARDDQTLLCWKYNLN